MKWRNVIIITLSLLIIVGSGFWFASHLERYTRFVDDGAKLDILLNPWHAAQAFLKQQDKESHRSFNLHPVMEQLKPYDALVLFNGSSIGNPATRQKLTDWMHGGGHLIITAQEEWDFDSESADPFLDEFGVRLYSIEEDEDEEEVDTEELEAEEPEQSATSENSTISEVAPEDEGSQSCAFMDYDNVFQINWDNEPLQIEAYTDYTLDDEFDEAIRSADTWPNALLQYRVGAGKITVIMDPTIWHNHRIGEYDHAFFLWQLVKQDDVIWFVSSNDSENLIDILWRTAPYLMIGLGTMLLFWSWRRWVRFGPMIPDPDNQHRQLLEHIEAATRFDWNHHQGQIMIDQLRLDIEQAMNRLHHLSYSQHQEQWLELLAQRCPLSPSQIQQAMTQPSPQREHPWAELISQLQIIRNAL